MTKTFQVEGSLKAAALVEQLFIQGAKSVSCEVQADGITRLIVAKF